MEDRPLSWVGTSLADVRVQRGLMPTDWKPTPSVGAGIAEVRIRGRQEHRLIFVARFEEAVYVLHAFEKKSRRTRKTDLDLARTRLKEVEVLRRTRKGN